MTKPRSLRRRAFGVGLAVLLSPLLLVMATSSLESAFGDRTLERTALSADEVAHAFESGGIEAARPSLERAAAARHQRIRLLSGGLVVGEANRLIGDGLGFVVGDVFYGPERKLVLAELDRDFGAPAERLEVTRAKASGSDHGCRFLVAGNLFFCATARILKAPDGTPHVLLVEGSSRRALQAIYEARRQVAKLLLFGAAMGLLLAWWSMRSFVEPVEALRAELLARVERAAPKTTPRKRRGGGTPKELSDLEEAFETVLEELAARHRKNEAFLQDLAHEFKNPVAAIRASAERLSAPGALDEERKRRLSDALTQSSTRLDALVTQFLELARAEAGLPGEERGRLSLSELCVNLVEGMRRDVRNERVRFDVQVTAGLETVAAAPQLELALRNLLENAASFAGEGGSVRVEAARAEETPEAVLTIRDSGPGIAAEDLPRVFDRFFTRRADRHGTGLGLALARAVIEAHGGRIEARSPPGEGATFEVRLPLAG